MFLEFTTINDSRELHEELEFVPLPQYLQRNRKYSLWEQFFYCECGHIYYVHVFGEFKCDAEYFGKCECKKFVSMNLEMEIIFTVADVFEVENPDHSETDSPQWWIEFKFWLENEYEKQNNKTNS